MVLPGGRAIGARGGWKVESTKTMKEEGEITGMTDSFLVDIILVRLRV